jgi:hypothetical protein
MLVEVNISNFILAHDQALSCKQLTLVNKMCFCSVCKQQDITSTMRNEVLSRVSGSFGALVLALKLSKMMFLHVCRYSVAGASSSVHGCLFTCAHLHSWYWWSWCHNGACLNKYLLSFYAIVWSLSHLQTNFRSQLFVCFVSWEKQLKWVAIVNAYCK